MPSAASVAVAVIDN